MTSSCDKKGHAALLVADQIKDHHMAKKVLPKVLDKVRSKTPGKIKVADAFVAGGASLSLRGRGVSRRTIGTRKAAAVAKVRKAVKSKICTPTLRAILNAKTPQRKPPRSIYVIRAPNFDAERVR